jgi:hypothetical protein
MRRGRRVSRHPKCFQDPSSGRVGQHLRPTPCGDNAVNRRIPLPPSPQNLGPVLIESPTIASTISVMSAIPQIQFVPTTVNNVLVLIITLDVIKRQLNVLMLCFWSANSKQCKCASIACAIAHNCSVEIFSKCKRSRFPNSI